MKKANTDINHLILLCKQGNSNAQFEVYNNYYKAMYNTAIRIVKDSYWAEDIMQEAFLKAFTKLDSYKGEVAFGAWLKKIVINHSLDDYRKTNSDMFSSLDDVLYKTEDKKESLDIDFHDIRLEEVKKAMNNLKENYRIILTLYFIEGYDQDEICEIMKINPGNCRTMMSRAKESLKNNLMLHEKRKG